MAACDAMLVASEPGKHQELNASPISFSKFHRPIAGRLQALYSERIIALPEKLKSLSFGPYGLGHQPRRTAITQPQSTVSRGFPLNDIPHIRSPFYYVDSLPPTPFCFFKPFSIFVFTLFILPSHFPDLITLRRNQLLFSFMYQWLPLDIMVLF